MTIRQKYGSFLLAVMLMGFMVVTGCKNPFGTVVTLTKVMEAGRVQYDVVYQQGLVPADVETKAQSAWSGYQRAATTAADALEASKTTGDQTAYERAFAIVRAAVGGFVDAIAPVLSGGTVTKLKHDTAVATKL